MRRRGLYLLLFGAPALLAGLLLGAIVLVFALAIFWVFIFGDDTWPSYAYVLLGLVFAATAATTVFILLRLAYEQGARQEEKPTLNRGHVAISATATLVLLAGPGLYLWHANSRQPETPEGACARYCTARGFPGSGMPPRDSGSITCTCYGALGRENQSFPLPELEQRGTK